MSRTMAVVEPELEMDPTLNNILEQRSLKWIFVGGKGGVGKTTTACALAALLARHRSSVLIISTDPAHNLSDAFRQKFTSTPTPVEGVENLSAMEVDPNPPPTGLPGLEEGSSFLAEISGSIPGIDEAMSFAEVMKQVQIMDYECVVFDTAPTGHTLRLLQFPTALEKGLDKLASLRSSYGGLLATAGRLLGGLGEGGEGGDPGELLDSLSARLDALRHVVGAVNAQFRDPELTTFVCVCIPEFLSLYETERLVQELARFDIDVRNVVINQVIALRDLAQSPLLAARARMQQKYLDQFYDLYEDFHVVCQPLLEREVRGVPGILHFGRGLLGEGGEVRRGVDVGGVDASAPTEPGGESDLEGARREVERLQEELRQAQHRLRGLEQA